MLFNFSALSTRSIENYLIENVKIIVVRKLLTIIPVGRVVGLLHLFYL